MTTWSTSTATIAATLPSPTVTMWTIFTTGIATQPTGPTMTNTDQALTRALSGEEPGPPR